MSLPRILVVDDSSTIRIRLKRLLTQAGYEVILAPNGAEGLAKARTERPDMIILDIQMPELDGYGVCEELKCMGKPWSTLPILFLTGIESHALDLLGNEMGAYLQKPWSPESLLEAVAGVLAPQSQPEIGVGVVVCAPRDHYVARSDR